MKLLITAILLTALVACNDHAAVIVKDASTTTITPPKPKTVEVPAVRYGIEGFYAGMFENADENATEYDPRQITICIDSLNATQIYGHSLVAGNERPFSGSYRKEGKDYHASVKEPGDDPTDGSFEFTLDPATREASGEWHANNLKAAVPARKYKLKQFTYHYDPKVVLPEEVLGEPLYGSLNTKTEEGESLTKDVFKNASLKELKSTDVENMYRGDLEVLRNTIYARHGYSFKNLRMRMIFDEYVEWYHPVASDVTGMLTAIEKRNIELIKRYETHASKYYTSFGR